MSELRYVPVVGEYTRTNENQVHLWPGDYDREQLFEDTPIVGVSIDDLGVHDCWENYHGTSLIIVDQWHTLHEGVTGPPTSYWVVIRGGWDDAHPDLRALLKDKVWLDRLTGYKPEDLQELVDDIERYLVSKGWKYIVPRLGHGPSWVEDQVEVDGQWSE